MGERKLRICITTADEPLVVNGFIKEVVAAKHSQIVGIALIDGKGAIPSVSRSAKVNGQRNSAIQRKIRNMLSLILMFGMVETIKNALKVLYFHLSKGLNRIVPVYPTNSIKQLAKKFMIPVEEFRTVHDEALLKFLHQLKPDIVINQAPGILREAFLDKATIGVLNRHNGLLPKNRGRFAPFWALYKQEPSSGVSIHFVVKELDAGKIIVQKKIKLGDGETVLSLVKKCYAIAPSAMIEAIEKLESGDYELLPNSDDEATYNTNPTLKEVLQLHLQQRYKKSF